MSHPSALELSLIVAGRITVCVAILAGLIAACASSSCPACSSAYGARVARYSGTAFFVLLATAAVLGVFSACLGLE